MIKKIDHFVITTTDVSACIAFYEKLGFRSRDAGCRWELFAGDFKINVHIKGHELEPRAQHVQPGSIDICFELEGDVDDCRDELQRRGMDLEPGVVTRHGVRGEMRSLYLRDPDGNLVELCSYS